MSEYVPTYWRHKNIPHRIVKIQRDPDGRLYYIWRHYTGGGKQRMIFEHSDWKICPLICYDLRFPVWSKNTYTNQQFEYDLLIYIARKTRGELYAS